MAEALKALDNELLQDILLGKGKDYAEPNNWRGICLAEIPAKIQRKGCTDVLFYEKCLADKKTTWGQHMGDKALTQLTTPYGIPENMVKVIVKMYKDSMVIFKLGQETREIPYELGVKQGNNMAPVLFIYLMNAFAETLNEK
eukprot:scaffold32178_cov54-Attheya_sp.AAC.2